MVRITCEIPAHESYLLSDLTLNSDPKKYTQFIYLMMGGNLNPPTLQQATTPKYFSLLKCQLERKLGEEEGSRAVSNVSDRQNATTGGGRVAVNLICGTPRS